MEGEDEQQVGEDEQDDEEVVIIIIINFSNKKYSTVLFLKLKLIFFFALGNQSTNDTI